MIRMKLSFLTLFVALNSFSHIHGLENPEKSITRSENLNGGKYIVNWTADLSSKTVVFIASVKTLGFVQFGLARRDGQMDVITGGVYPNGTSYFYDQHGFVEEYDDLEEDDEVNWELLEASENGTHTVLTFQRKFDTCDEFQDVVINDDTLTLFWGYGSPDGFAYPKNGSVTDLNFGNVSINLLDVKPQPLTDKGLQDTWDLSRTTQLSGRSTSYWCTVHKGPSLASKNHIVQFDPQFENTSSKKHIHHFVLYKCTTPSNKSATEYFDPYINSEGAECYESTEKAIPVRQCRTFIYVWAYGGQELILPENVGIPIGEESDEYYMLEIHYDNPEGLAGIEITAGIKMQLTSQLRTHDAGVFMLGYDLYPSLVIPPDSDDFNIFGHCSSNCTSGVFPPDGVKLFGILPHSHLTGRKMRLQHFREKTELDWIINDENYDFRFQQTRILSQARQILPGDHLTLRCSYDNSLTNGSTVGGFSTREEMCLGFIWYYPRIPMHTCTSAYPINELNKLFGIRKITSRKGLIQPVILEPASMWNKTLSEVMDEKFHWIWNLKWREELQDRFQNENHLSRCSSAGRPSKPLTITKYPEVKEAFESTNLCSKIVK